jgi:hypothetical protein
LPGLLVPRPYSEERSFRNAALAEKGHFSFTKHFIRKEGVKEKIAAREQNRAYGNEDSKGDGEDIK